ncbi:hypothetical protein H8N03_10425 [Ramlibacter sp. USB13]|uniref:Uncharacterized protein n=1 Tax=Ramlibacter cellulosilyticus TaxID=2764187 RepID=A0A923MQI8_9BURK|nr:hypothetical protein [Ramlibacter cellulosilyticus]MBC5783360.1 hypothetical protein [Ramlibacter cellulosilyticus]
MEKVAGAGEHAEGRWKSALGCIAALAGCVVCPAIQAQDADTGSAEVLVAEARTDKPVRVEVQTSALPRFDAQDGGFQAPRVDFSVTPLNANGNGLGAVLGMANPGAGAQPMGLQPRPAVDLGLRWTQRLQSQRIDVTAWRRLSGADDAYTMIQMRQPVYGARVELNLSAAPPRKAGFAFDRGFVGLQLEGGARITIKRKDGRPMVYYRTAF